MHIEAQGLGKRFGDDFEVGPEKLDWMVRGDKKGLDCVEKLDAPGFYRSVVEPDDNARKVCGLGALYAFTRLMKDLYPESRGEMLRYAHAPDPAGGVVSFASMSFVEGAKSAASPKKKPAKKKSKKKRKK